MLARFCYISCVASQSPCSLHQILHPSLVLHHNVLSLFHPSPVPFSFSSVWAFVFVVCHLLYCSASYVKNRLCNPKTHRNSQSSRNMFLVWNLSDCSKSKAKLWTSLDSGVRNQGKKFLPHGPTLFLHSLLLDFWLEKITGTVHCCDNNYLITPKLHLSISKPWAKVNI